MHSARWLCGPVKSHTTQDSSWVDSATSHWRIFRRYLDVHIKHQLHSVNSRVAAFTSLHLTHAIHNSTWFRVPCDETNLFVMCCSKTVLKLTARAGLDRQLVMSEATQLLFYVQGITEHHHCGLADYCNMKFLPTVKWQIRTFCPLDHSPIRWSFSPGHYALIISKGLGLGLIQNY
jgi:hypothetical protein